MFNRITNANDKDDDRDALSRAQKIQVTNSIEEPNTINQVGSLVWKLFSTDFDLKNIK